MATPAAQPPSGKRAHGPAPPQRLSVMCPHCHSPHGQRKVSAPSPRHREGPVESQSGEVGELHGSETRSPRRLTRVDARDTPSLTSRAAYPPKPRRPADPNLSPSNKYQELRRRPVGQAAECPLLRGGQPTDGTHPRRADRRPLCCQVVLCEFLNGAAGTARRAGALGRRLGAGPGVAGPKSRRLGCELAALETEPFAWPRARLWAVPREGRVILPGAVFLNAVTGAAGGACPAVTGLGHHRAWRSR
jgi:hypothetical protein